jgi:nitrogen fixation NifU-like protein
VYSQTVKEHFANPRNVGELDKPDRSGEARNEVDGDQVQLHLALEDDRIVDVKMKVMGCVAAIASTSLLTEMIKGLTTAEALALTKEALAEALGGLPENKKRCSLTCIDALHHAFE